MYFSHSFNHCMSAMVHDVDTTLSPKIKNKSSLNCKVIFRPCLLIGHIKKFTDIPASITISHLPRLWRFTLLLYILEHISLTLNFKHFWNLPLHSLCHFLLNHTKHNLKAFTCFGPISNSSSPFLLLRIYGNSKGRAL